MLKMCRILLLVLAVLTVDSFARRLKPIERTTIKLSDVKPGKDREDLEHYLYQGYWNTKYVWKPKWIKVWQERKILVPKWKRICYPTKVQEWVTEHAAPPSWLQNVRGQFIVELPQ